MIKTDTVDGNHAAALASYNFTEVAAVYPITPSSPMAENLDEWSAGGMKNIFGQRVKVVEMQSEAGAAGAMHGSLQAGSLTTTYTASQGLLLMIPNIYKMVGELLPGVIHVSARALATHALSIFGDHQDVMACRQTGAVMIASTSVQEAFDLSIISHLSAIKARLPVIHFFDGFRTSHEYQKISLLDQADIKSLVDFELIDSFRRNALSPMKPVVKGTAQNPDIYFQGRELQNKFFDAVPAIVAEYMQKLKKLTGREYRLFDYYGAADSEDIIIAMGSVCDTIEEVVDYLNSRGEKTGAVKVHLYRPFSISHLLKAVPKTVKRIAVLDMTKEPGAAGEPLYLDVTRAYYTAGQKPLIIGGRYGLGLKDTRPSQIISVFENLKSEQPVNNFTIGIVDDLTMRSLPESSGRIEESSKNINCKFWGLGSDGTVGANKSAIQIIGNNTDLYVQGYFSYDSKKSGGSTVSHLRFGNSPIKSRYLVFEADYIGCHNKSFINNIDVLKGIKENGIFVLNCDWDEQQLEEHLPDRIKKTIAEKNLRFYTIDAVKIAFEIGLGNRINMIMQAAFFKLINIIPVEKAAELLKDSVNKAYGRKGKEIVEKNHKAVDFGISELKQINIPPSWRNIEIMDSDKPADRPTFITEIQSKMAKHEGDELTVGCFEGMEDGTFPVGVTAFEKRGIAVTVPQWQPDNCIQCGFCSYICPHSTIRMFLLDKNEVEKAPESFTTIKAKGKGLEELWFRVQVSPLDCTGCGNCADVCPARQKALILKPSEAEIEAEGENWEYTSKIRYKNELADKSTIKGSQLLQPLVEFNGACPGCGEPAYIKLLTQLFGERMMIANATGCSSIWGASAPSIAYTATSEGRGPSWANSLFEDNAEYGYGMFLGVRQQREKLARLLREAVSSDLDERIKEELRFCIDNMNNSEESIKAYKRLKAALKADSLDSPILREIDKYKDFAVKRSFWLVGGDGWAYDIGFSGVDHVLSTSDDVNLLVMDTEVYSNTGGQSSKSTPLSAIAKFAVSGKRTAKKDLGLMMMSYGNVYVAQIAMGADMNQTLRAVREAESYNGPSLIIAYSPCISHGIKTGMGTSILHQKRAVEAGYWHLYRYNPDLAKQNKNPFILDSKPPVSSYEDFINTELRYSQLKNIEPDIADRLYEQSRISAEKRYRRYKKLSEQ